MNTLQEDEFVTEMEKIGMTNYEARVYFVLFQLKYATIQDIYKVNAIPRNKIYETLESLDNKGFAAVIGNNPLRYACCDVEKTFAAIKNRELEKYEHAEQYLKEYEQNTLTDKLPFQPHAYELHSKWAIDNHLQTIISKTQTELVIGVYDTAYFNKLFTASQLKKTAKKLNLYIVVKDSAAAAEIPVRSSVIEQNNLKELIPEYEDIEQKFAQRNLNAKLALISDKKTILHIDEVNGELAGTVLLLEHTFFIEILFKYLQKYLIPVM
ncbi:MAG TPA: hypothetical protein O0X97_04870 [Methanocorpusculum sp.]|nr:hypothetical protein [Methanocorpusculum sp.]